METPFCPTNFNTQREREGNLEKKNQKDGQDFEVRSSAGDLSHSQPERKRRKGRRGEKKEEEQEEEETHMLGDSLSTKVSLQVRCWNPGTGVPAGGYLGREPKIPTAEESGLV